ncbi:MAG: hypothetical protein ACRC6V_08505 [Bacteroidales bacterium]
MKKQHYIVLLSLVASINMVGQSNEPQESLTRELIIEKEFTPIVRDASKVIRLPEVESPVTSVKSQPDYTYQQQPGEALYQLTPLSPAAVGIAKEYTKSRGWASLSAGNNLNLNASLGYALVNSAKTQLIASYDLFNTSGNREIEHLGSKEKFSLFKNQANITLDQRVGSAKMNLYGDFKYSLFNYPTSVWEPESDVDKQSHTQFRVGTSFSEIKLGSFNLETGLNYSRFNKGYFQFGDNGIGENNLDISASTIGNILGNIVGGADLSFHYLGYDKPILDGDKSSYSIFKIRPKVGFEVDRFSLMVGLNMELQSRNETKFKVTPDIHLNWSILNNLALFADLTGGTTINGFESMESRCRYLYSDQRLGDDFASLDIKAGIRTLFSGAVSLELFGGYTRYDNMSYIYSAQQEDIASRLLGSVAQKVNKTYFTLNSQFVLSDKWDLRAGMTATNWGSDDIAIAMPSFEANIGVTYSPISKLRLNLDYYLISGREMGLGLVDEENYSKVKLGAINEIRLGGSYNITRWLTANLQLNNLMNQKQESWYGIPEQGFNFLIGASVRF